MESLAILGCVLFAFALCARRVEGTIVTAPMVFVSAGLLAGWTGLLDFGSAAEHAGVAPDATHEVVLVVAELALVLLLFTGAARRPAPRRSASCRRVSSMRSRALTPAVLGTPDALAPIRARRRADYVRAGRGAPASTGG